jgi:branched-chain amino acid aminotransferase
MTCRAHDFVVHDNELVRATADDFSGGRMYGRGVFSTIAILASTPFLWEKHWRRLVGHAARIGVDLSQFSEKSTRSALVKLIEKNEITRGRARVTFFDRSSDQVWQFDSARRTGLSIVTGEPREPQANLRLTVSPFPVNSATPLAGIKSCNYLDRILVRDESLSRGFHEAVQLNERGEIVSAVMANVFWFKNGRLFTPPLSSGCLAGTTREFILETLDCEEVSASVEELHDADQIFLTSAGIGIAQVAQFEDRKLELRAHPITRLIPEW